MMMQECLFILLSQSGTRVSQVIRLFTKKPYNHASVAMDLSMDEIYSFCRTYRHLPLPATFNREIVGRGTFGRFPQIPCEIYAVPLTKEKKEELYRYVEHLKHCRSRYSYNLLGLCTTYLQIRWTRCRKMHCAEFVARLLEFSGVSLEKQPSLYIPDDFRYLSEARLVYRGELNQFYAMCQKRTFDSKIEAPFVKYKPV